MSLEEFLAWERDQPERYEYAGGKVLAAGSVRYPDIAVTCTPFSGSDDIVPEPVLVIEVVSPSTEREDRGRKKFDYFATRRSGNTASSNKMSAG